MDSGQENGNYFIAYGGLYMDSGKDNGNYYSILGLDSIFHAL